MSEATGRVLLRSESARASETKAAAVTANCHTLILLVRDHARVRMPNTQPTIPLKHDCKLSCSAINVSNLMLKTWRRIRDAEQRRVQVTVFGSCDGADVNAVLTSVSNIFFRHSGQTF
jgi:hypothetical protein